MLKSYSYKLRRLTLPTSTYLVYSNCIDHLHAWAKFSRINRTIKGRDFLGYFLCVGHIRHMLWAVGCTHVSYLVLSFLWGHMQTFVKSASSSLSFFDLLPFKPRQWSANVRLGSILRSDAELRLRDSVWTLRSEAECSQLSARGLASLCCLESKDMAEHKPSGRWELELTTPPDTSDVDSTVSLVWCNPFLTWYDKYISGQIDQTRT